MLQPCVLPSNASPLVGGTGPTPRVLQEHSGNRQHNDFKFSHEYEPKCPAPLLSENTHPRLPLKTQHLFRSQQPTSHTPFRSGYARPGYGRAHHPTPAEKDDRARRLLRRFHSSEQYAKYRARQGKTDDKNGDQKWPDHLEQAFFRALVEYPPMGRKKHLFKEKQRGRNELIADWIEMATGQNRNRKQVSSHIQVLKPFVAEDPLIMAYLSKTADPDLTRYHGGYYASQLNGRGLSRYPVPAPPQSGPHVMPLPVLGIVGRQGKLRNLPDVFEPVDFEMFVQRKLGPTEHHHQRPDDEVERLHTYTKQIPQPWEADDVFSDWNTFAHRHPTLAAMHAQRPVECNVIAAQASLALHSGPWKDKDGLPVGSGGIELGISFHCRTGELPRPFEVICQNNFFERGELIENSNCHQPFVDDRANNDMQVMFGSNFWVKALSAKYKEACEGGPEGGSAFISTLTATQDIFVKTATGTERVVLIHWSFRESTRGLGRTSWRRVVIPPSTTAPQYTSPLKVLPADAPFNFNDDPMPNLTASGAPPQPTLQSPFEYDSGTGSALSSATWPTSISDASGVAFTNASSLDVDLDNTFDFTGGNIDISYDPNLSLDGFDTSTFNFDAAAEDFVADPVMEDYSQSWVGSYTGSFDGQQTFPEASFSASTAMNSQNTEFNDYGVFDPQIYGAGQEAQAFGGAGQDIVKEEEELDVMAGVSAFESQVATDVKDLE